MRTRPTAVFMAFGTKGDVFPIAAIAAAFASDQHQYDVAFITHSAHENLGVRLGAKRVAYFPVSSPPVLSPCQDSDTAGSPKLSFSLQKEEITRKQRKECVSIVERIFGESPSLEGDVIIINFFALEGWSLAELFRVHCVVAAPYVVPYSAPSSFECQFRKEFPLLYKYLKEAPADMVGWEDVLHWLWPLFTDDWGLWRSLDLKLSACPFTDPVTGLPTWHERPSSPLLLYGFSKEIVECPGYWPSRVRVCGFWFLPAEWQFSCFSCADASYLISSEKLNVQAKLCLAHSKLQHFLDCSPEKPVFISLSSVGSMGFLRNPKAFLRVLGDVLDITSRSFILFSAGYEPLDVTIKMFAGKAPSASEQVQSSKDEMLLFDGRLLCFSGNIPYSWLFPRCAAAIHHGGRIKFILSPYIDGFSFSKHSKDTELVVLCWQVICPFMLDQFYWAERMFWLGVAPEPLNSNQLLPDRDDDCYVKEAAYMLAKVLNSALSSKVKLRASEIAKRISTEDGVSEAVRIIKEEITGYRWYK